MVGINLKGAWLCIKYELEAILRADGGGAIVNTSSWLAAGALPHDRRLCRLQGRAGRHDPGDRARSRAAGHPDQQRPPPASSTRLCSGAGRTTRPPSPSLPTRR